MITKRLFVVTVVLGALLLLVALTPGNVTADASAAAPTDTEPSFGTPSVNGVTPASAPNDLDTAIVITGTGFTAGLSGTLVVTSPAAYLGSTILEDVSWVSTTTLHATVPWGLEPGVYTPTVVNPDGGKGSLSSAFTVTQGIGIWTSGGPYGGDTWHVVLNPVVPNQVYASVWWSGLFASYDAAGQWQPVLIGGFPERPALDAGNPQVIYVGTDGSLSRSDDGGLIWQTIPRQRRCADSVRPVAHPTLAGTVYLAVFCHGGIEPWGGLYKSTDWGLNWITMTTGLSDTNVTSLAFDPDDPNVMYLSTHSGEVYTSTNGGESWTFATRLPNHVDGLSVNPFGAHEVWAESNGYFIGDPALSPNLFKSLNPGLTAWETITITHAPVWSLTFHPTISGTIWAGAENGYFSTDGGGTWSPVGSGLPGWLWAGVKEFAIDPHNPSILYAATGGGVYKSYDNGKTWNAENQNLAGILPIAMSVSPFNPQEVYANTNIPTLLRTNNGGQSWQELDIPPPGWSTNLATDPFIPERVYFGGPCDTPCFRLSEDGGLTYREVAYTLPATYAGGGAYTLLVAPDPIIPGHILIASNIVHPDVSWGEALLFSSDDYGEHWQHVDSWPLRPVNDIAFDPINTGVIYIGTGGLGPYKSTDAGLTWQVLSSWPGPGTVNAIAVHPGRPDIVFALGQDFPGPPDLPQGVYRSRDGGVTWEFLPGEPSGGPLWALAFALTDPPTLYTGGLDSGLWRSTDDGQTWKVAEGMSVGTIRSLATSSDGERVIVYVGISGGAIRGSGFTAASAGADLTLLGSGVYRLTALLPTDRVYLPLVIR